MIFRALRYTLCKNRRNCSETEALFITCVTNVGRIITAFEPREDYSSLGHMQGRRGRAGVPMQCLLCCSCQFATRHNTDFFSELPEANGDGNDMRIYGAMEEPGGSTCAFSRMGPMYRLQDFDEDAEPGDG